MNLQENINRIKQVMGLNENEQTPIPIPPEVMRDIEKEADSTMNHWNDRRSEQLNQIQNLEAAIHNTKDPDIIHALTIHQNELKNSLPTERTDEDRPKLIEYLKNQYRIGEAFRLSSKEREEKLGNAQITNENLINVFVTAIEGGSNYWAQILDIPRDVEFLVKKGMTFSEACGKYVLYGGDLTIYDAEEVTEMEDPENIYSTDKPDPLGTIDMDSLLDAISIMKRDYPDEYENIVMDEYDANDADVFFQVATMGEVVYG